MLRWLFLLFSIVWSSLLSIILAGSVYDMTADKWEHYPGGLAVHKNGNLNLIIKDHLTNTRAVVLNDNSCSSTTYEAQYDYYPYGKVLRKLENPRSRFQSTDHETDSETGYNNRNARWYDDESFQFLQIDPMQNTYPSWSPYHYVARNPISLTDPTGMNWYKSNSEDYDQYIWYDGDGEREGYKNLGSEAKVSEREGGRRFMAHLKSDGTAQYLVPMYSKDEDIIGPGKSGITPTGSIITAREKTPDEVKKEQFNACVNQMFVNRLASGALGEPPLSLFDLFTIGKSVYTLGGAVYSMRASRSNIALGVSEHLDDFAKNVNGSTWKSWGSQDFQSQFIRTINNPANKIHFNMTGPTGSMMNPWKAVTEGSRGLGSSRATSWELFQLYSNPGALQRTTFYYSGSKIPSPF